MRAAAANEDWSCGFQITGPVNPNTVHGPCTHSTVHIHEVLYAAFGQLRDFRELSCFIVNLVMESSRASTVLRNCTCTFYLFIRYRAP